MTDYNFAKNYENIKDWEFKNQSQSVRESDNFVDQLLNFINSYPNLISLIKTKKILFVPTLFVLAGVVFVEIVALIPAINIKRLESKHFEYEDKVNALNGINLDLENKFIKLKKHTLCYLILHLHIYSDFTFKRVCPKMFNYLII